MRIVQETKASKEQRLISLNDAVIGELSTIIAQIITRSNGNNFDENSELVKTWVRLIESGQHNKDDIPGIGNLREIVSKILSHTKKKQ